MNGTSITDACEMVLSGYKDLQLEEIGRIVDKVNMTLIQHGSKRAMDASITRKLRSMKILVNLYGIKELNPSNSNTLYQVDKTGNRRMVLKGAGKES